jgi:glutamate dehydrogenase/leucine dehydrogenase
MLRFRLAGRPVLPHADQVAEVVELGSVTGFVVFDLPGAPLSAGGTRLAADVSVAEVALLARAMTYKFAVLGQQVGGAKAGVRGDPADRAGKAGLMTRFCAEVRPLVEAGRFLTGPDMGTAQGADVLRQRGVVALPDFVCNAGAVIGYRSAAGASPGQVLAAVEATISGLIRQALDHEDGPLAGACERAGAFLRGWWGEPPAPPFAPAA